MTEMPDLDLLDRLKGEAAIAPPPTLLTSTGQTLYESLMCGDVARLVSHVLQMSSRSKQSVHFELRFDQDQPLLARFPWELIADRQGCFLVREGLVDLTRYITFPQPPPFLDAAVQHLPLLRVVARPPKLPQISPVELALSRVVSLSPATFEQLRQKLILEHMQLWGLHFDGHGSLILQCNHCGAISSADARRCYRCRASLADAEQTGALAFEDNGEADWITADQLASVLYGADVQLALLLACETARVGDRVLFSGMAPALMLAGVPAVIGLQYPVSDAFANSFVNSFYRALVQSDGARAGQRPALPEASLLNAFRIARRMNTWGAWYCPVLYLRHQGTVPPVYESRSIDTALPAEIPAGVPAVVLLWIRRPETQPLTEAQLRKLLGIPEQVPVQACETEAELKFDAVKGRTMRRGEVEVRLSSPGCEVIPERIRLPVDEHLDAPKAFFTVLAREVGTVPVIFSVWQDGGQIAAMTHFVQVVAASRQAWLAIKTGSRALSVQPVEAISPAPPYLEPALPPPPPPMPPTVAPDSETWPSLPAAGSTRVIERAPVHLAMLVDKSRPDRKHEVKGTTNVGRAGDNHVVLDHPSVSRHHAWIKVEGEEFYIFDVGSANGTFVNNWRVEEPRRLESNDVIRFGSAEFVFLKLF
jgi:hypothetical protein